MWRNAGRTHAAPFDDLARFHNYGNVENWGDPTQSVLGDFAGLDGIRTEDAQVRQDLVTIYQALIAATDCDGFRVDTAKHVEMAFWETFLPAIDAFTDSLGKSNFIVYAEVFDGSDATVAPFTAPDRFNSALYFPMRNTMENVFVWGQNTSQLTDRQDNLPLYDPVARDQLVNFLDNHDMPRLLSSDRLNGNVPPLKLALTFLYTFGQVPCLYYGTEQGFNGGHDPYDREDMFDGEFEFGPSLGDNFDFTHELFLYVRRLNLLRQAYPALVDGAFVPRWETTGGGGLYVFSRTLGPDEVIVALNTSAGEQTALNGGLGPETTYPPGTVLANVDDPAETVTVGLGGAAHRITFSVPGFGRKVFVRQAALQPLAPSVTSCSPGHDEGGVAPASAVVLEFDQPMDMASTEAAFALAPAAAGSFAWENDGTRLVFTPASALASNTWYEVELAASAQGTNGLLTGAAFVSMFDTTAAGSEPNPLGAFVMDGVLDGAATTAATVNGMSLYLAYDSANRALYVATEDSGEGNDHFIFIDNVLSTSTPYPAPWSKAGAIAANGPYLADENDNNYSAWAGVHASSSAATGPNGGVLEGVFNVEEQYGGEPAYLYVAVGVYATPNGGALQSHLQVPHSQDQDGDLDADEFVRIDLATGAIDVPPPPEGVIEEVPLTPYVMDGQHTPAEDAALRDGAGIGLYADFNGKRLYLSTQDAGEGRDHFVFVTDEPLPVSGAPWSKAGDVAGLLHFLADENDNTFEGWFIHSSYEASHPAATPGFNGGFLEGTIDPIAVFGAIPEVLYLAAVPYETANGGVLYAAGQTPAGNGNGDVEAAEYYVLDMTLFDTDGDGLADLAEDVNRNGVMDAGESGARVIDSDGDGANDGDEDVAGTDARDADDVLNLTIGSAPGGVVLEWPSKPARLYTVEGTEVPTDAGAWATQGLADRPGTGATLSHADTNAPAENVRQYRVRVRKAG